MQKHRARTLHYDFRLEKDGVLKSWAFPKGIPEQPGVSRLAIRTEDHDLEFGSFEGEISDGEYGAGKINIWDSGTYDLHHWNANQVEFTLRGTQVSGLYNLIKFNRAGEREWLLRKQAGKPSTE